MLTLLPLVSMTPVLVNVTVRVAPEVMVPAACRVPPANIKVLVALPSPIAALALALSVPAAIVVAPL